MLSPRNSLLVPRRFYTENEVQPSAPNAADRGLKTLTKHINGLKKKIKKYEEEFEDNFGYRPSHSDKMSNRDIKRLCSELNKLRKEHKLLKEDPIGALLANANGKLAGIGNQTNNNSNEKSRTSMMQEMVKEVERKLSDKRLKHDRPDNMDDLSYEQLMDEKTAVQKALLQIEGTFGRPISKEDRDIVRPLYDRYRTLKRLLIRAGPVNCVYLFRLKRWKKIDWRIKILMELLFINFFYFYRTRTKTAFRSWRRSSSMRRWISRLPLCRVTLLTVREEPANLTCPTAGF